MTLRREEPLWTWDEMKVKLNQEYLSLTFQDQQLDKWSRVSQGTRSVVEYIEKFDEFMTRCGEFVEEPPMMTLSTFMSRFAYQNTRKHATRVDEAYTRGKYPTHTC